MSFVFQSSLKDSVIGYRAASNALSFCKQELKMSRVKSEDFVAKYFSDVDKLLGALQCYRKKSKLPTGEKSLIDLVKQN